MRWIAAVAGALLLAGCASTVPVPPEPTGEELDALIARELDLQWQYVGLTPDAPRPAVERIRIVPMGEAEQVHRECMVEAGYGGFRVVEASIFGGASNLERLAIYTCSAQYPVMPANYGLFGEAELGYLYDYYRDVTAPCLEAAGVAVAGPPTREEYLASGSFSLGLWTPHVGAEEAGGALPHACPSVPPGFRPF